VDDQPSVLEALTWMIGPEWEVTVLMSPREAAALLERGSHVDFLLSDYDMPGMTGIDLCTAAMRLEHRPRLAIMTASITDELRAFAADADIPILEKPFDRAVLRELLG